MPESPSTRLPLYAQIEDVLAARISSGAMPVGTQLPSEEELSREFGVSRTTVRVTIQNLVRQGLVEIRRGRGTFVASPRMVQELAELTGFVEDMRALGRTPTARVLSREIVPAASLVAEKLAVPAGTAVVQIRRVRLSDGVPLSFDETYLPEQLGRRVITDDLAKEPIFTLLEERYDTPLVEAEYVLEATVADPTVAMALEIPVGSPIFLIERTSYTSGHRAVDYERLYYRGDYIRFKTRLARRRVPPGQK
ncbi:GntR family transcriptional regulator [Dyella flava]|uniref:GntR family transcriptional regulator n=1 Tax=Dyella flava TaxID=1920170 RepID=A0ABS2K4W4_9GAMM|nr:GntR family transcriptional regulator [Dyella flava]MBM7126257.1 GntR family transcriptional regulator [Dyella flava]GLQ48938.1 GntR family transcriptional regulator [Dyella flava]